MDGWAVVAVNEGGARPPVVFFHTWESEADHLRALGVALGPDQPLFGIEPPDTDGPLPVAVDGWIEHHRRHLATLPTAAPYRLAGFSFGGVVALEIARQLQAEGSEVAWLGLIDTLRPKLNPRGAGRFTRYHLQEVLDLPEPSHRRAYVRHLVDGGARRTRRRVKWRARQVLVGLHLLQPRAAGAQMRPLKRSIWRSYLAYEARPYEGPVALFPGRENQEAASGDPSLRWSKYLRGGFEVTVIDGAHLELFAPANIASVAEAFRASLARADCPGGASRSVERGVGLEGDLVGGGGRGGGDAAEVAGLEVGHGLADLGLGVHHERAHPRHRLADRPATEQQQLE